MHFNELFIIKEKCEISSWQLNPFPTAPWQLILHHVLPITQPRAWIWPTVSPTWDWRPKNTAWTRYPPSTEEDSRAVRDSCQRTIPMYYWHNCCFLSSYMCFTLIHREKEAKENFFKVQSFPKPMIYIRLSCSWRVRKWHVGKFSFGKHKMETFSVHTHCGSMSVVIPFEDRGLL